MVRRNRCRVMRATHFMSMLLTVILLVSAMHVKPSAAQDSAEKPAAATAKNRIFVDGSKEEVELAKSISMDYLLPQMAHYGIRSADDLQVQRVRIDEMSFAHTRVQQLLNGVPVWGGEAIIHLNPDGSLFSITDSLEANLQVNVEPVLNESEAAERAIRAYGCDTCLTAEPQTDLWVMRYKGRDRLVYRVQLERLDGSKETAMPVYFIDAHTGKKVHKYNNMHTGSGTSLYSGTVSIGTYYSSDPPPFGVYYMQDLSRKIGTFNGSTSTPFTNLFSDVWDDQDQKAGVDVHYGLAKTYDYFKNVHNYTGIDGSGGPLTVPAADGLNSLIAAVAHYSTNFNNAFWSQNERKMYFGDGDGVSFSPLVSLDVCAHEMMHGITQHTVGSTNFDTLTYENESGALNESWSDVFGAMVERYVKGESSNTWKIGEDCYTPNTPADALRYMDNPPLGNDPDHYSERYTGTLDNGGVHTNSGIANKAFYLVAKGGSHSNHPGYTTQGIGVDAAAKIWFKALEYLPTDATFSTARAKTLDAAAQLYKIGSKEYNTVARAWGLCGVGSIEFLTNGGFENVQSPWVLSGQASYFVNGGLPESGTGYITLGSANSANGAAYQQFSLPNSVNSIKLTFWLNVTSQETTTVNTYDDLFVEIRDTNGNLLQTLANYSNLDKGNAGDYLLKGFSFPNTYNFDLTAYKGQTIRLQFRTTTDVSNITTFRVDRVSVFTPTPIIILPPPIAPNSNNE
ncbi:MAG: M4 family metallopeptidase [Acidobacteriota bacterium]